MKSVLITGASRGIGLATTLEFARSGYEVLATMRRPDRATDLRATIEAEDLPVTILPMDVDSDESVRETIGQVVSERGAIDVLVNNAGIEGHGSIEETPLDEFRAVMETNYFGAIRCIQAVLPSMREAGRGCIVNVTSISGRIAAAPLGAYTSSKHALEALSEVLAQEVRSFGIRVAIVEPGIIGTDMPQQIAEADSAIYPQGRRMGALFAASLENPPGPEVVGEAIREIVDSSSWQLRYLVGPDAEPFLAWRQAMTDDEWVESNSVDDDTWYAAIERDFGIDVRPK